MQSECLIADFATPSGLYWVATKLRVARGEVLRFEASGVWSDAKERCGAEGYERAYLNPFKWLRRVPGAPWFSLCAAIAKRAPFQVRPGEPMACACGGELFLFANDAPGFYFNNSGALSVTIFRETQGA